MPCTDWSRVGALRPSPLATRTVGRSNLVLVSADTPGGRLLMVSGIFAGRNSSNPRFIPISVQPIATTETATPITSANCCFAGVAPTRNPVFRSCDVLPALAEAMHTTPPILIASAAKAEPVQPMTRNMAQDAIRVAIALPEIGFYDVPINPVLLEATVTKRKPKLTTSIAAKMLLRAEVLAPGTG